MWIMTDDALEQQIANFDRCVVDRDIELAETVLAPDFALVFVQPALTVMPRARWLQVLPDYVVHSYEVQEKALDRSAHCAAVLQRVAMQATVLGSDRSGVIVTSDVWHLQNGGWRVWRRHSTPLAAGKIPGAT
jgi:hypothetical protein